MVRLRVHLPTTLMLLCAFFAVAGLSGYSRGSAVGRILRGAPLILGNSLGLFWIATHRPLHMCRAGRGIVVFTLFVFLLGILVIPLASLAVGAVYPLYILGDSTWFLWICLNLVVFCSINHLSQLRPDIILRRFILLARILFAYWLLATLYHRSLIVPDVVLFAVLMAFLAATATTSDRLSSSIAIRLTLCLGLLVLGALGWNRSVFAGFAFSFFAWFTMIMQKRRLRLLMRVCPILVLLTCSVFFHLGSRLRQSRLYATIVSGEATSGTSVINRLLEAQSAWQTLQRVPGAFVTGFGHGAVYAPQGDLTRRQRNLTNEGLIHNIHVGPSLLLFRYGVFGMFLYLVFWSIVWRGAFLARRLVGAAHVCRHAEGYQHISAIRVFYIGYFTFCNLFILSHFGNHFLNAFFGFSFASTVMFVSSPQLLGLPPRRPVLLVAACAEPSTTAATGSCLNDK